MSERVRTEGENCRNMAERVRNKSVNFFLERDRKCQNQVRGQCQNTAERARTESERYRTCPNQLCQNVTEPPVRTSSEPGKT